MASALPWINCAVNCCGRAQAYRLPGQLTRAEFEKGLSEEQKARISALGLPLIVKPSREGPASQATKSSRRKCFTGCVIIGFFSMMTKIPIGEMAVRSEFTVAIVGEEILPSIRIQPAGTFYDYEAKYL